MSLNLTLSKENIAVEPVEILTQEGPTITKFYVFRNKEKNKDVHPWLHLREFYNVEGPNLGFFKCSYKNIAGEKETAYVTYDGQPITNKKMVSFINSYINKCKEYLKEQDGFEVYREKVSKELDNLQTTLNNVINAENDFQRKNNL